MASISKAVLRDWQIITNTALAPLTNPIDLKWPDMDKAASVVYSFIYWKRSIWTSALGFCFKQVSCWTRKLFRNWLALHGSEDPCHGARSAGCAWGAEDARSQRCQLVCQRRRGHRDHSKRYFHREIAICIVYYYGIYYSFMWTQN